MDGCIKDLVALKENQPGKPTFLEQLQTDLVDGIFKGHVIKKSKYSFESTKEKFIDALISNISQRYYYKQLRATLTVSLFLYIDICLFLFFLVIVYSLQPPAQVFVL